MQQQNCVECHGVFYPVDSDHHKALQGLGPYARAPFTIIDNECQIGEGSRVFPFTQLKGNIRVGKRSIIGSHVSLIGLLAGITIGDESTIQTGCVFGSGTVVGDRCMICSGTIICNDKRPPSKPEDWQPVIIEDDVVVGCGVTICPGVRLGKGCFIGAGAVITKDVPAGAIVAGNPARVLLNTPAWQDGEGFNLPVPEGAPNDGQVIEGM